jgi:NAD(P)-dependent dehydrogenase (short-subunit alcohol dehydrogenase family)
MMGSAVHGTEASERVAADAVKEITGSAGDAVPSSDTVASEAGTARIVATALDAHGSVDALIHNAGTATFAPIEEMSVDSYRRLVSVHLDGGRSIGASAMAADASANISPIGIHPHSVRDGFRSEWRDYFEIADFEPQVATLSK